MIRLTHKPSAYPHSPIEWREAEGTKNENLRSTYVQGLISSNSRKDSVIRIQTSA
jgi:hypothetical protein